MMDINQVLANLRGLLPPDGEPVTPQNELKAIALCAGTGWDRVVTEFAIEQGLITGSFAVQSLCKLHGLGPLACLRAGVEGAGGGQLALEQMLEQGLITLDDMREVIEDRRKKDTSQINTTLLANGAGLAALGGVLQRSNNPQAQALGHSAQEVAEGLMREGLEPGSGAEHFARAQDSLESLRIVGFELQESDGLQRVFKLGDPEERGPIQAPQGSASWTVQANNADWSEFDPTRAQIIEPDLPQGVQIINGSLYLNDSATHNLIQGVDLGLQVLGGRIWPGPLSQDQDESRYHRSAQSLVALGYDSSEMSPNDPHCRKWIYARNGLSWIINNDGSMTFVERCDLNDAYNLGEAQGADSPHTRSNST